MRPISEAFGPPVPGELTARHRINDQTSVGCTCAAVYGRACSTIDRVLTGNLSDRGGRITATLRNIPLVISSVDVKNVHEAMSTGERNEGESRGKERQE